jgi:hypothetical protein
VRHGDIIYGNMKILALDDRADYWEGPGGERRTWDELTEMGVTEIAREAIRIPHDVDDDEDDSQARRTVLVRPQRPGEAAPSA